MKRLTSRAVLLAAVVWCGGATTAAAQVFGTFTWQMQPYCNVITLTLTQFPAGFVVDGADNQCGAARIAAVTGQALIHPDGTVGLNFTIIGSPDGKASHVAAVVSPASGSGTWTDSVGNTGTFALSAAVPGLPARPVPVSGLGVAAITTVEIAAGAVGASDINTAEVQARVSGTCPAGQAVSGVAANGAVTCQSSLDMAGAFKRVIYSGVVATTAVSFATATNLSTLTFTSPVSGTAIATARGYCNLRASTSGDQNVVLGTALAGEASVNSFSEWVAIGIAPDAASSLHQLSFFAERGVTVTAGAPVTLTFKAYRESGTNSMDCRGSYRVHLHPSTLP